jgi:hypothetical protein
MQVVLSKPMPLRLQSERRGLRSLRAMEHFIGNSTMHGLQFHGQVSITMVVGNLCNIQRKGFTTIS